MGAKGWRENRAKGLCGKGLHPWVDGRKMCKDCHRQATNRWAAAHREQRRENTRRWREANPEKSREQLRRWQKANLDKHRQKSHRRRARLKGNGVYTVTDKDMRWLEQQPCAHSHLGPCNGNMHLDHVIPISRGGSHGIGNLQALCQHHNISKKDRLEVEVRWLKAEMSMTHGMVSP